MTQNELFKKNCGRWSIFQYVPARKLPQLTPKHVFFHSNANGMANLKEETEGAIRYFHSENNPSEEAKLEFEALDLQGIKVIFYFGVGLAYFYEAAKSWLKEDEGRHLVFLEDKAEVIYQLLHTERAEEVLNDKQVRLILIDRHLENAITPFMLLPFRISGSQFYKRTRERYYIELKSKIEFTLNLKSAASMEYSGNGRSFFGNYFRNLLLLPEAALGVKLFGHFANIPAIICGAGPSLEKNLPVLTQLRDRALIFAGGTAMNALNAADFLPHFGVGIDPNRAQFTRLIMNQAFEIPFFYRNRLFHKALELIHGKHLYINGTAGYPISSWFEEELGIKQDLDIQEGCNVVNFSLAIAHAMGCNPIILVGLDLAYTNEKSYAPGVLNHPIHNRKDYFGTKSIDEDVIVKDDIFGQPTFTLWKWVAESLWFAQFAQLHGNKVLINSTEGGIGFSGIPNFPLADVAENLLTRQYDFEGMTHDKIAEAKLPEGVTRQAIVEKMGILLVSLDRSEFLCRTVQKECEDTVRKYRYDIEAPILSEEGLKALEELLEEIAFTQILEVYSDHFLELHALDYDEIRSEFHTLGAKAVKIQRHI